MFGFLTETDSPNGGETVKNQALTVGARQVRNFG
jgi:hypothetical protein